MLERVTATDLSALVWVTGTLTIAAHDLFHSWLVIDGTAVGEEGGLERGTTAVLLCGGVRG